MIHKKDSDEIQVFIIKLLPVFSRGNPWFISHWLETAEIQSSPFLSVELTSVTEERHSPHPAFDSPNGGDTHRHTTGAKTAARFFLFLSLPLTHTHSLTRTHSRTHTNAKKILLQNASFGFFFFFGRWLKAKLFTPVPFPNVASLSVPLSFSRLLSFFLSFSSPRSLRRFLRPSNGRDGRGNPAPRSGKPHALACVTTQRAQPNRERSS